MTQQMTHHKFIFSAGIWLGEGQVAFNTSMEKLKFRTQWNISQQQDDIIRCKQQVELAGITEQVINYLTISAITPSSFVVELTNDMVEKTKGTGIIDDRRIAWEFQGDSDFEGLEVYDLQEDDKYRFHAEYLSSEQFRTIIDGLIWRKVT